MFPLLFGYLWGFLVAVSLEDVVRRWHRDRSDVFAATRRQIRDLPTT